MVSNSEQNWEPGSHVRVGFLTLMILAKRRTPMDGDPDEYLLTNGERLYTFTPHKGLFRLTGHEGRERIRTDWGFHA